MLRITVHEDLAASTLKLEGKLAGVWVAEAAHVWRVAIDCGKSIDIDLKGVTAVDEAGWELLKSMKKSGANLIADGVRMKSLLHDMTSDCCGKLKDKIGHLAIAVVVVLGIAAHPAILAAQDAPLRLTLQQAVSTALRQNPEVAIANLNLVESQEDRKVARSRLLPQVTFSASDKVERANIESLLGSKIPGFPGHIGPFWAITAGPGFSTPLFDLTLWRRWQAAGEDVHTRSAEETTAREFNAELVVSQYLGGLRASADVQAAKSRLDLAKALLDLATDLQKNGAGTGIDTLRANVQYQNERQRFTAAGTQLKLELYGLNRLLNLDPHQTIELADAASFFQTPAYDSAATIERAYDMRPELKTVLSQMRSTELQKRAAKSQRLPRLSLGGGWTLQGVTPTTMIPAYEYGASFDMPLFTGGRIQAETAIQEVELKKLAQTERETRNRIALEVKSALAQLESARTEVEAANLGVTLSNESVKQAQDRFRAGVANNIEVITAQDELSRANDNQISALYRYNQSRADLARATGMMETLYSK